MTYTDKERLIMLEKTYELNFRLTHLYASYLERFPEAIDSKIIDEICGDGAVDKKDAIVALLAEFFALDGNAADLCGGAATAFLSPDCPQLEKLLDGGWCRIAENTPPECWHGENVMFRNVSQRNCDGLFFSLIDKF